MTNNLTAAHYNALDGATENNTDPKPYTDEAIRARRDAIREGRLRVIDPQDPETTREVVCAGCAAGVPTIVFPTVDAPFPVPNPIPTDSRGSPTFVWAPPIVQRPTVVAVNELGYTVEFMIDRVTIDQLSGECKKVGSNCETGVQCGYVVSIFFSIRISIAAWGDDVVASPQLPNILITDPFGPGGGGAMAPTDIHYNGTQTTGHYEWSGSMLLDCDSGISFDVDPELMAPTPLTGAWSSPTYTGAASVALSCGECSKGGSFPTGG